MVGNGDEVNSAFCGPRNGKEMFAILRLVFFPLLDVVARAYIQLLGPL